MENTGWIKLHRALISNKFLLRDTNAFVVFIRLLLLVDRKTGQWEGGRIQLGTWCGLNPMTAYKSAIRLQKAKMVTLSSNNKYTTFSICNWSKYQMIDNSDGNNERTTGEQPENTLTRSKEVYIPTNKKTAEYKKREFVSANLSVFERRFPDLDVAAEWQRCQDYFDGYGKAGKIKDWSATFRNWLASPYEKKKSAQNFQPREHIIKREGNE